MPAKIAHEERHATLSSTNARAIEIAATVPLPALVVAQEQTAGKGRGQNQWWSGPGALTFTVLIDAGPSSLPGDYWPLASLVAADAVGEAIAAKLPAADVKLKWPNDVLLNGKKVAGILVEIPSVRPPRLAIGVGINVNNSISTAPAELQTIATAVIDVADEPLDAEALLQDVVQLLLAGLAALARHDRSFLTRWRSRSVLAGKQVEVDLNGRVTSGRCLGIDDRGGLQVQTAYGVELLFAGVVRKWE